MARQKYFDPLFLVKLLLMIFPFGLVSLSLSQPPASLAEQLSVEQSDEDGSSDEGSSDEAPDDEPVGYAKPECTGKSCEPLPDGANACNTPAANKNPHCNGGDGENELIDVIDEIEIVDPIVDPIDEIAEPPNPDIDNVKPAPEGGGTCNNPDDNSQNNSGQECPGWEIVPDYCETDPSNPDCKNEEDYCKDNPDDPTCKLDPWEPIPDYCLDDPEVCSMPGWGEIPDYCLDNPEVCEKPGWPEIPDYCADDPGHIDCKEPELPELPDETVACFAEDGTTVYISEDETVLLKQMQVNTPLADMRRLQCMRGLRCCWIPVTSFLKLVPIYS